MSGRACPPFLLAPQVRSELRTRDDRWRVSVSRVGTGVVTGRMERRAGNVHADAWLLFRSRTEFESALAQDPLRFAEPLMTLQLQQEFDHVIDHAHGPAIPANQPAGAGRGDGCTGSDRPDQDGGGRRRVPGAALPGNAGHRRERQPLHRRDSRGRG